MKKKVLGLQIFTNKTLFLLGDLEENTNLGKLELIFPIFMEKRM